MKSQPFLCTIGLFVIDKRLKKYFLKVSSELQIYNKYIIQAYLI